MHSYQHTCPSCGCVEVATILTPELPTHYAKLTCDGCGRFIKWIGKPENELKRQHINGVIQRLLDDLTLTRWERGFLASLSTQKKISPKQLELINKIAEAKGVQS